MGLGFSHCDAQWAYSGFMRFRTKLAAEAGIALLCMQGFAGSNPIRINGDHHSQPVISWDKVNDDIKPLLDHSDCDGELTVEECKKVAPRLRELVANWSDNDRDKVNALELVEGMETATRENEPLEFR